MDGQVFLDEDDDVYCVWRGEFDEETISAPTAWTCSSAGESCGFAPFEEHQEYAYSGAADGVPEGCRVHPHRGLRRSAALNGPGPGEQRIYFKARKGTNKIMDYLVRGMSMDGFVKCVAIRSTELVRRGRKFRDYAQRHGGLRPGLTAASMMGNMQKVEDGSMTLQVRGGGPIGTIVVRVRCGGQRPGLCHGAEGPAGGKISWKAGRGGNRRHRRHPDGHPGPANERAVHRFRDPWLPEKSVTT